MKPKTAQTLTSLVAIKRKQAEQAYAGALSDVAAAEAHLEALEAQLRAVPGANEDFEAAALSDRFGHSRRLLALIAAQRDVIAQKKQAALEYREVLKRAFGSERALGEIISDQV